MFYKMLRKIPLTIPPAGASPRPLHLSSAAFLASRCSGSWRFIVSRCSALLSTIWYPGSSWSTGCKWGTHYGDVQIPRTPRNACLSVARLRQWERMQKFRSIRPHWSSGLVVKGLITTAMHLFLGIDRRRVSSLCSLSSLLLLLANPSKMYLCRCCQNFSLAFSLWKNFPVCLFKLRPVAFNINFVGF